MRHILALLMCAMPLMTSTVMADLPITTLIKGNPSADKSVSWWSPNLVLTNSNTTLLCASAKAPLGSQWDGSFSLKSEDGGKSWSQPEKAPLACTGEPVVSRTTGAIFRVGDMSTKEASSQVVEDWPSEENVTGITINSGAAPVPPRGELPGPIWANELPPLSSTDLAKCESAITQSTDDGATWSPKELIWVNGSLGQHYTGFGLNHGIEIQNGPHKGRLAMARRLDCPAAMGDHGMQDYFHSFVLYSDNQGKNWTVGQLLPRGSTECQIAEMHNGSLLMTSRMYGQPYLSKPPKASDLRRMFARSDDGGHTWSDIWYVEQRQPDVWMGTCDQPIVSDPSVSPTIYYGHPGNNTKNLGKQDNNGLARANYTLHQSKDGGASWEFVNRVYPLGAGYSDALIVPDTEAPSGFTLLMLFQKTFNPPVPAIEGGGYDLALARLQL